MSHGGSYVWFLVTYTPLFYCLPSLPWSHPQCHECHGFTFCCGCITKMWSTFLRGPSFDRHLGWFYIWITVNSLTININVKRIFVLCWLMNSSSLCPNWYDWTTGIPTFCALRRLCGSLEWPYHFTSDLFQSPHQYLLPYEVLKTGLLPGVRWTRGAIQVYIPQYVQVFMAIGSSPSENGLFN